MAYRTEIRNLDPGNRFYFPNDHNKITWLVTESKRTASILAAYKKRPEMLTEQANYKAYVNTLEQILNVGKQKRIVII